MGVAVPRLGLRRGGLPRPALLAREGGEVVLEGVPIEVEGKGRDGLLREVLPLEGKAPLDLVEVRIESGVDRVVRVPGRAQGKGWESRVVGGGRRRQEGEASLRPGHLVAPPAPEGEQGEREQGDG